MATRMTGSLALKLIREAAADSGRVYFTVHAEQRMRQRRTTRPQVIECLLKGRLTEGPAPDLHGNWTCRVERRVAGDAVGVAVAIERETSLIVITVFEAK